MGSYECDVTCKSCGAVYHQVQEDQKAGFRDMSFDVCPYCNSKNDKSMEVDFYNSRLEGEDKEYNISTSAKRINLHNLR